MLPTSLQPKRQQNLWRKKVIRNRYFLTLLHVRQPYREQREREAALQKHQASYHNVLGERGDAHHYESLIQLDVLLDQVHLLTFN